MYLHGPGANGGKPLRFIWNKSKATATNLYLMLYPRGLLARLLETHPKLASKVFEFLNRITADDLRNAGRVYGGGLHKIEPKELGTISAETLRRMIPELDDVHSPADGLFAR